MTHELNKNNYLKEVKEHYEDYPYPYRNPHDEKDRILVVSGEYLGEINHWLFKGKEDFKSNFRVLVAGGGTGDSIIYLAYQLMDTNAELVYIDFSKASMEVAQKRAEVRGLKNITWINDSLLNIPNLNIGKFDFINCIGVLHHLESPDEGLRVLKSVLSDKGGMHIMLYAKYGRTGVYQMQELMRKINYGAKNRQEEIANTKTILNILPNSNWFKKSKELFSDIESFGDAGIYDLLLHKQDRSYTIEEMHEFIEKQNLNFVQYSTPEVRIHLKPEIYIKDFSLLNKIKSLNLKEQHAICELIRGDIIKHNLYISNGVDTNASLESLDNIPYFYGLHSQVAGVELANLLQANNIQIGSSITFNLNSIFFRNLPLTIFNDTYSAFILKHIDGVRSIRDIFNLTNDVDKNTLLNHAKICLTPLIEAGVLLLRDKSISIFS